MTLVTSEDIAKACADHPETNAYMPLSAGVESTATLLYAVKDPEIHPLCVHWYEPRYGQFADAMAFYSKKQADHFNLPYGNDTSMLSTIGYTKEVPIIITTHKTTSNLLYRAIKKIEDLDFVVSKIVVINIDKNIN